MKKSSKMSTPLFLPSISEILNKTPSEEDFHKKLNAFHETPSDMPTYLKTDLNNELSPLSTSFKSEETLNKQEEQFHSNIDIYSQQTNTPKEVKTGLITLKLKPLAPKKQENLNQRPNSDSKSNYFRISRKSISQCARESKVGF
jgi:hypothetical protein